METIVAELQKRIEILETKLTRQERAFRKFKKDLIPESERKVRTPSGFAKPTYLSPGMCEFLEIPEGSELARTEVTKRVLAYVKEQTLQNKEQKRVIDVDDKLRKLLNPAADEQVTYFSIQRLLKVHYIKPAGTEEPPVTAPTPVVVVEAPVATKQAPAGSGAKAASGKGSSKKK